MTPSLSSPNPRRRRSFRVNAVVNRLSFFSFMTSPLAIFNHMTLPFRVHIHLDAADLNHVRRSGYISISCQSPPSATTKRLGYSLHCKHVFSISWTQKHLKRLRSSIPNISDLFNVGKVELYRGDIMSELHILHANGRLDFCLDDPGEPSSRNPRDGTTSDCVDLIGPNDPENTQDSVLHGLSERLSTQPGDCDVLDNDFDNERRCVVDCILKNSIVRSEFDGEKFLDLAKPMMERIVSLYDDKKVNIIKADVIISMARKISSMLCLTKTQNEQLLSFWKTMTVFINPKSEVVTKRIHASYNTCVRQSLKDEQQKKRDCQRFFQECCFFQLLLIRHLYATNISCRVSHAFLSTTDSFKFPCF